MPTCYSFQLRSSFRYITHRHWQTGNNMLCGGRLYHYLPRRDIFSLEPKVIQRLKPRCMLDRWGGSAFSDGSNLAKALRHCRRATPPFPTPPGVGWGLVAGPRLAQSPNHCPPHFVLMPRPSVPTIGSKGRRSFKFSLLLSLSFFLTQSRQPAHGGTGPPPDP